MPKVDERVEGDSPGGEEAPDRRPIPLPPSSLRPPPRERGSRRAGDAPAPARRAREPGGASGAGAGRPGTGPAPSPVFGDPADAGARRGFTMGFLLPALGVALAAFLWWVSPGGESGPAPGAVRARAEREPGLSSGEAPVPGPGSADPAARPGGDPGAAAPDRGLGPEAGGTLTLQIASFRTRGRAEAVLEAARARTGLRGIVVPARVDGVRWHRILLGAFGSEAEAMRAASPLLREGTITEAMAVPMRDGWRPELTGAEEGSR